MIVVKPKYPTRRYCYGGSGIFSNLINRAVSSTIARKVINTATKDGVRGIINKAVSSPIAHKLADGVVDGAASATKKVVENAIVERFKRPRKEEEGNNKRVKIDVTHLIDGSGIVLD